MKIVLLALYDVWSFGIRGIHRILKENEYDVTSIFFKESSYTDSYYTDEDVIHIVNMIKEQKPDLIGIAVRSPIFPLFKSLSNLIRKEMDVKILVGGHHPTAVPETCKDFADYICTGEGEYVTLELCNRLNSGKSPSDIEGLWPNRPSKPIEDMDMLPFCYYGDNQLYYKADPQYDTQTQMAVWGSRGCFYKCTYCYEGILRRLYKHSGGVRRRTVDNLLKYIEMLKSKFENLEEIIFTDQIFTWGKEWVDEFCEKFPSTGLKFRCFGHFTFIDKEMLIKLRNAGMTYITFGIESGSKRIRKIYKRHGSIEQIIEVSKMLSELGIMGRYDVIINNPFDNIETMRETRELIGKLATPFIIRNFELRFFPGTEITNIALEQGVINEIDVEGSRYCKFGNWHYNYECK